GKLPAIISGIPGHEIENVKVHDIYLHHRGGGTKESAAIQVPEDENKYPDPHMFGPILPASGFFVRHAKNVEFTNIEIAYDSPDERPVFAVSEVDGADFFRIKAPAGAAGRVFSLNNVTEFRTLASRGIKDVEIDRVEQKLL
ncbi:MAG: rhamnogalacturonidase, partial [Terriglobales bacterium]